MLNFLVIKIADLPDGKYLIVSVVKQGRIFHCFGSLKEANKGSFFRDSIGISCQYFYSTILISNERSIARR